MLNRIIRFSLRNRPSILVVALLLMLAGMYTTQQTEVDVFPDLNAPTVVVMTEAQGMAAEEVEMLVTFPLETAVNGATHVRRVRSSSTTGFSVLWVEFEWNTDIYLARQIVSEKLATVNDALPDNVGQPTLGPQSSILGEVMIVGLTSDSTSMLDLRTIADWTIRPRLLSTGGVAQVSVLGGDIKEYQILIHPNKMKHYGVTLAEVMEATRRMNLNTSGGVIYEHGNEYIVRGVVTTNKIAEIGSCVVKLAENGMPITLNEVSTVQVGSQEPKLGLASERGKPAVLLTITKQPNTSTMELTEKLEHALEDLQKALPEDIKVSTDIFQQSKFIDNSIHNVKTSLIEGALFVVFILYIFLANIRSTLITLVTIPLSLLITLLVLHLLGFGINTMSLGGMAIAIGSLVDDAIVDVENVWRMLKNNRALPEKERKPILEIVYLASKEVRMPILNSTLIIVASFVPLFFLNGMEGKMLIPLGVSFIVTLFASTVVALTLTPVLCSYLLKDVGTIRNEEKKQKSFNAVEEPKWLTGIKRLYERSLTWVLQHKKATVGTSAILFAVSIGLALTLGRSFLPAFNEGSLTINISSLPGISLKESDNIGRHAEEILLSIPEIKTVARKTGRAELDEHALGVNASEIEAPYELDKRSRKDFLEDVRHKLGVIAGANIEIGQPISHRIDAMLSGTKASIAIKLFGNDLHKMYLLGNQIKSHIDDIEGITDLNVEQQIDRPELRISPKHNMLAKYGITMSEFNEFVAVYLAGETVSQVYEGGKTFDLIVRADEANRISMEQIKDITICNKDGKNIPFSQIANIESDTGPNTINRENVKRKLVISANSNGRDLRGIVDDIQNEVKKNITLPEGYYIEYGGQFESEQAASRTLFLTSILSIIAIFMFLYMQFHSIQQSAIILINLPLALIGGILVLLCTTGEISIPATIGFISLFGIATRNGMLLITRYNVLLKERNMPLKEGIIKGSVDRLNPILMTALTSALALIPIALNGDEPGNEIQSPMAKVILGGLITSTVLNAYIVPAVQMMMHQKNKKGQKE